MTFSRLTLGDPRLKSKLRGGSVDLAEPCNEDLVHGTNVLTDPGFENHLNNYEEGPDGEHFPGEWSIGTADWADGTEITDNAVYNGTGWAVMSNNGPAPTNRWLISTSNPRSGTHHARFNHDISLGFGEDATAIIPMDVTLCDVDGAAGARIAAGDFVEISYYMMSSNITNTPVTEVEFEFRDSDRTLISGVGQATSNLNTAYAQYSHSAVAPSGAYYVQAFIHAYTDSSMTTDVIFDIDDCALEIQP